MGHDIHSYTDLKLDESGEDFKFDNDIAYLRYSMGNENKNRIYTLLDCRQFNNGVSGSSEHAVFPLAAIKRALVRSVTWGYIEETEFLAETFLYMIKKPKSIIPIYFG